MYLSPNEPLSVERDVKLDRLTRVDTSDGSRYEISVITSSERFVRDSYCQSPE